MKENKNLQNDSLIEKKEIGSHRVYIKSKDAKGKKANAFPSPSDLNRAQAVSIDKYVPFLFVFAIIFIIYYVRNNEKKNNS
ncbi:hypothetical protein GCM10022217_27160 [Chryseobacterium ginsenosidimutans]